MQSLKFGYAAASRALLSRRMSAHTSEAAKLYFVCLVRSLSSDKREVQEKTPVIRIPRYMQKRIENVKETHGKNKINITRPGKLLIQSRNPDLNQSAGYTLGKFEEPRLCCKGWKHNKSFGDYFSINGVNEYAPFVAEREKDEAEKTSFKNFRISEELLETLHRIDIRHPTTVQRQAIPKVMRGHNILCAAETGSGKTLCYLLPIVQRLQARIQESTEGKPKVRNVILVPSRELAEQVAAVSRTLCAPFGFQTRIVGGGRGVGHIKLVFKKDQPDILVATPGALVKALRRRCLDLSELNFFVIDEADTMFDPSFADMLEKIFLHTDIASNPKETQGLGHKTQLLVVGATFPGGVGEVLSKVTDLGSMSVIKSRMLHFLMPHVKQTFLKVKGTDKVLELQHLLKELQVERGGGSAVVFCNKSATVNWLGYTLEEMGVEHLRLQGEMPAAVRAGIFRTFQKDSANVLVCTDIASRGLDTSKVRLVVNYDCPESHTDYIHRAGRVGRLGGLEGVEVVSFVTHPWDVELVQMIETAARRRTSLPGMESEIHEPQQKDEVTDLSKSFEYD